MPTDKQRRESERRRLQRQVQRRREQAARRTRFALISSIVGAVVVIAVVITVIVATGGDSTPAAAGKSLCTWTTSATAASRTVSKPPTTSPSKSGTVAVSVTTSQGPMTFTLDRAEAPCAVESFLSLVRQKYYDDTPCHRLTSGTLNVLQCGDPTGTGTGGPGYTFGDELTGKEQYTTGVLAMANSGANTNGSQFFIVYKDSTLQPNYTIFGTVTSGLDVVDKVAAAGSDNSNGTGDGKPKLPITLTTLTAAS